MSGTRDTNFKSITRGAADDNPLTPLDPLSFYRLTGFSERTSGRGTVTYQLSNDNGTTWYYYNEAEGSWQTTDEGKTNTSSAAVIAANVATFPRGSGQLLWRCYLPVTNEETAALKSVTVDYDAEAPVSLKHPVVSAVNNLFRTVFSRLPTQDEWTYWVGRVTNREKQTIPSLFGAMQWQQLFGQGTVAGISTSSPTIEVRNGTNRQGLAGRTLKRLTEAGYGVLALSNARDFLRDTSKLYVIDHTVYDQAQELATTLSVPVGLDLPLGERVTEADMLLILGYDFVE